MRPSFCWGVPTDCQAYGSPLAGFLCVLSGIPERWKGVWRVAKDNVDLTLMARQVIRQGKELLGMAGELERRGIPDPVLTAEDIQTIRDNVELAGLLLEAGG